MYSMYNEEQQQQTAARKSNHGRGVARLTFSAEAASFADRNEPFVCRSCVSSSSLDFWASDANLLEVAGTNATFAARVAPRIDNNDDPTLFRRTGSFDAKDRSSNYQERTLTLEDFLSSYNNSESFSKEDHHLYAAQVDILESMPNLLPQIQQSGPPNVLLEAIGSTPPVSHRPLTMYLGHGPLTTQTHYDSMENVVCVMSGGSKTFDLYDPAQSSLLLYVDRSKYGNGSPIITGHENKQFPMAKYALPSTVRLQVGDCLYLPVYWYHTVSSHERTLSINWWRMPNENKMQLLERMFCRHIDEDETVSSARTKC